MSFFTAECGFYAALRLQRTVTFSRKVGGDPGSSRTSKPPRRFKCSRVIGATPGGSTLAPLGVCAKALPMRLLRSG